MTESTDTAADVESTGPDESEGGRSSSKPPTDKLVLIGAAAALIAIVVAAQRDIATQPNLRGPRWLWHAIASTPPGVVIYGMYGPKGHPFGDLPSPTVQVVDPAA
ncbi:MAG: hypothetical protein AAFZ07_19395 [Actinomycetota bacterium]